MRASRSGRLIFQYPIRKQMAAQGSNQSRRRSARVLIFFLHFNRIQLVYAENLFKYKFQGVSEVKPALNMFIITQWTQSWCRTYICGKLTTQPPISAEVKGT
jgi:hypothetical protein